MKTELEILAQKFRELGVDQQLDYDKFYLYSIITHSTAIEGSTITELENQIMFDNGIAIKGKSLIEQNMNLDLKAAYERALTFASHHDEITVERLKELSALTMKNTGTLYHTALGDFSSAHGDIRLVNVSAGVGGKSYMAFNKVPSRLREFCERLNVSRKNASALSVQQLYDLSFDAHYELVTIHPWADGNGRMARLVMNWLQFEFGLIPSRILNEDKENYIKALVSTRESGDLSIFRKCMSDIMVRQLSGDITAYDEFMRSDGEPSKCSEPAQGYMSNRNESPIIVASVGKVKTRDKIIELLRQNPGLSATMLAAEIGITAKGIQRQLASLKSQGIIRHHGPAKGGRWEVL